MEIRSYELNNQEKQHDFFFFYKSIIKVLKFFHKMSFFGRKMFSMSGNRIHEH